MTSVTDFKVKDLSLASWGRKEIKIAEGEMPGLMALREEFGSASVTRTRQPAWRRLAAEPLPTSPKPATTATLPAIITSVPRRMASTRLSRQPYRLSNLDLVTLSFTLMAGTARRPSLAICHRRCTPVVVSSDRPRTSASISGYFWCISSVRSPPSSRIMFGVQPSGPRMVWSMHHQNSSSDMPFQANTGTPLAAIAAAA